MADTEGTRYSRQCCVPRVGSRGSVSCRGDAARWKSPNAKTPRSPKTKPAEKNGMKRAAINNPRAAMPNSSCVFAAYTKPNARLAGTIKGRRALIGPKHIPHYSSPALRKSLECCRGLPEDSDPGTSRRVRSGVGGRELCFVPQPCRFLRRGSVHVRNSQASTRTRGGDEEEAVM
ncbi:hypothetical protein SKAU_G00144570 [Synaphobranchus kaupii]|uniref:Uncharacterized protein n=1 Tax=Synaphobranchus kaupii TaxID=118154 RepID=A0A9Q1FTK4_SYNKA|nr:hypothetical protein SKAU_G00144570 [Synaphobranchus kaupii]